jgi:hypothetical protein
VRVIVAAFGDICGKGNSFLLDVQINQIYTKKIDCCFFDGKILTLHPEKNKKII